jgi:hypothetical protein
MHQNQNFKTKTISKPNHQNQNHIKTKTTQNQNHVKTKTQNQNFKTSFGFGACLHYV